MMYFNLLLLFSSHNPHIVFFFCIYILFYFILVVFSALSSRSTPATMSKPWSKLTALPPDAIFELSAKAKAAKAPKANLIIGAYRDAEGNPYPLKSIRKAEAKIIEQKLDYEYLPINGHPGFTEAAIKMLYADSVKPENVVGVQTLSGTGALFIGAFYLTHVYDVEKTHVFISNPSWINHVNIFKLAGFKNVGQYTYYDPKTKGLDFEGYKKAINDAPSGSIFIVHQCAHNPTGVDPSKAQWEELAELYIKKNHQVFFDSAYQGYASGSLDTDAFAARLFAKKGVQFLCAQSFSKNMGLYNQRIGTLSVIVSNKEEGQIVLSHLASLIRASCSNPPAHGARLAHLVLTDPTLRKEWETELKSMADRIHAMRKLVFDELTKLKTPGSWNHIINQIGMFSFLGLSKEQCQYCQDHNVFITLTGRANMAGLTTTTAVLLAKTIDEAVRKIPSTL